jgi:hypothetical protein
MPSYLQKKKVLQKLLNWGGGGRLDHNDTQESAPKVQSEVAFASKQTTYIYVYIYIYMLLFIIMRAVKHTFKPSPSPCRGPSLSFPVLSFSSESFC